MDIKYKIQWLIEELEAGRRGHKSGSDIRKSFNEALDRLRVLESKLIEAKKEP